MNIVDIYSKAPDSLSQRINATAPTIRKAYEKALQMEKEGHKWIEFRPLFGKYKFIDFDKLKKKYDSKYCK